MRLKINETDGFTKITLVPALSNSKSNLKQVLNQLKHALTSKFIDLYLKKLHVMSPEEAFYIGVELANFINENNIQIETLHIDIRDSLRYETEEGAIEYFCNKNSLIIASALLENLTITPDIDFDSNSCTLMNFIDVGILAPYSNKITYIYVNLNSRSTDTTFYSNISELSKLVASCSNLKDFVISGRLWDKERIGPEFVDYNGDLKKGLASHIPDDLISALETVQPECIEIQAIEARTLSRLLNCPRLLILKTRSVVFSSDDNIKLEEISHLKKSIQNATNLMSASVFKANNFTNISEESVNDLNTSLRSRLSSNLKACKLVAHTVFHNNLEVMRIISVAAFFRLFTAHYHLLTHQISDDFLIDKETSQQIVQKFKMDNTSSFELFFYITGVTSSAETQLQSAALIEESQKVQLMNLPKELLDNIIRFLNPLDVNSLIR